VTGGSETEPTLVLSQPRYTAVLVLPRVAQGLSDRAAVRQ